MNDDDRKLWIDYSNGETRWMASADAMTGTTRSRSKLAERGLVQLCPKCVPVEGIRGHSRALRIRDVDPIIAYTTSSFPSLTTSEDRSENPGVGGSIPSLPSSFFLTVS